MNQKLKFELRILGLVEKHLRQARCCIIIATNLFSATCKTILEDKNSFRGARTTKADVAKTINETQLLRIEKILPTDLFSKIPPK